VGCVQVPVADGGEGLLDVLGGPNRTAVVTGPLGDPVEAPWRLARGTAVIEMARASGLELVGGAAGNDSIAAATHGTGELIAADSAFGAGPLVCSIPAYWSAGVTYPMCHSVTPGTPVTSGGSKYTDVGRHAGLSPTGRNRGKGVPPILACEYIPATSTSRMACPPVLTVISTTKATTASTTPSERAMSPKVSHPRRLGAISRQPRR